MTATTSGTETPGLRAARDVATIMSSGLTTTEIRKQTAEQRITRLLDRAEPALRRVFLAIVEQLRNTTSIDRVADYIEAGNVQAALEVAGRAGARFAAAVNGVYIFAGESTADYIRERLEVIIDFDQVNHRAVRQMQSNQLRLVREFTQEQTTAAREAILSGMRRGVNPREQARAFRDSIGLTSRQVRAVENYRAALERRSLEALSRTLRDRRFDGTVRRAARTGTPLSQSQIDKMVDRYRQRYLKYRSEVIARTEALRSVHEGSREMYQQAFDQGIVKPEEVVQTWITAGDERVRDSHTFMNGQQRAPGEPFETGLGNFLRFPGDPDAPASETIQCRCVVSTRIK